MVPKLERGLVINYSYLWHREAKTGQEEGRKDRPCAIVAAMKDNRAIVLPITHTPPSAASEAIEIPPQLKKQIGLDDGRSWIVTSEFNTFEWPGHDLRPIDGQRDKGVVYGRLPPNFTKQVVQTVQAKMKRRQVKSVSRDDPLPKKDWGKKAEPSKPRPAPRPSKDVDRSR